MPGENGEVLVCGVKDELEWVKRCCSIERGVDGDGREVLCCSVDSDSIAKGEARINLSLMVKECSSRCLRAFRCSILGCTSKEITKIDFKIGVSSRVHKHSSFL